MNVPRGTIVKQLLGDWVLMVLWVWVLALYIYFIYRGFY